MLSKSYDARENILKLPVRRRICNVVRENAGCHLREVERRSGFSLGMVKYHLDYLARHGLIRQEKTGNNVRYFPQELSAEEKRILGLLRSKSYRHIVLCLVVEGASTQKRISAFVSLSQSTVSWHLKRLLNEGILGTRSEKGRLLYALQLEKGKIVKMLVSYRESFVDSLVDRAIEMWSH